MILIKVVKALIVRLALILHVLITVWRVTVDLDDDMYWLMAVIMVPFVIESIYTIVKRAGEDFLLFTPCFFFYLMTTIPCVWLLELKKSDNFLKEDEAKHAPVVQNNVTKESLNEEHDFGVDINPGTWTVLIEELLLYLLIISRWILPRGKVTREQLSELLFAFIGIASDIMEMFSLFGLEDVRKNRILSYLVLSCWSLSVLQFCMTVTVTHEPRRGKVIKLIDDNDYEKEKPKIVSQILAIICSMMMQDIPFLSVRLYTIITYNIMNYSLVFFTAKNCLVILLLLYKIAVLLQKRFCPEFLDNDEEDEEKQIEGDGKGGKDGRFHPIVEDLSDDSKDERGGKANPAFDKSPLPASNGPNTAPSAAKSYEALGETTPLRHRKGDGMPQESSRPPSTPQSNRTPSASKPGSISNQSLSPSTQTTQAQGSIQSGSPSNDTPVSSGFGWVTAKR